MDGSVDGLDGDFGFGDGKPAKTKAQLEPVAGLPKHTMLLAVVIAAALNFTELIINYAQNPYNLVDGIMNTSTAFNAVCAVFALGAGLFGALKRNRSAMILSFAFSCTTAAALRFDERRVAAPHEVLRICVALANLFSAWCSMITSEQTQRETVAKGAKSVFLFSADALDRFVVPGLAVVQLLCGIVGLVLSSKFYSHTPNGFSSDTRSDGKPKYMLQLGCAVVFVWNIVTAVLAFLSITTVGDKFGRGLLVAVASSALTGIALGFQMLRYFPGIANYWGLVVDCPVVTQGVGIDAKAEETLVKAVMAIMYASWLCNAAQVWSSWILSEAREERGGAGGLRTGGDASMSTATQKYHRWNVRAAVLQFGLASAAFFRFLALRRDERAYPDSLGMIVQSVQDIDDVDWTKALIEYRFAALITAVTSASCCISVLKGQKGKFRDMLLTAGALAAFLCTTVAFNSLMYSSAEVKYGLTVLGPDGFDFRNHNLTAAECAEKDLSQYPVYEDIKPFLGDLATDDFEAVFNLNPADKEKWGVYCETGYSAYQDFAAAFLAAASMTDLLATGAAPLAKWATAAVQCHDASFGIALAEGFGDGTEGFYAPPKFIEYPTEAERDMLVSANALNYAILVVAIIQQFLALAMSESNE